MKSKSDGWLETGLSPAFSALPTHADQDKEGPPALTHYAPVRLIKARVAREYGGINSSGGPQVSGRSDQSDFLVEQNSNKTTPLLYEHCCSGVQLAWVHLAVLQWDDALGGEKLFLHIRMPDVNVTSYAFRGVRGYAHEYASFGGGAILDEARFVRMQDYSIYGVVHRDQFTLLYTAISFKTGGNLERGWTTGTDRNFTA